MTALDEQIGGSHYKKYTIQPWVFCEVNKLSPAVSAIIWYIIRHQDKGGLLDLQKARHNIDMMIEHYYPDSEDKQEGFIIDCAGCARYPIRNHYGCLCQCHKETKDAG